MPAESGDQRNRRVSSNLMSRFSTSLVSFSLIQLALYMVPYVFPDSSVLTLLSLSCSTFGTGGFWENLQESSSSPSVSAGVRFSQYHIFLGCVYCSNSTSHFTFDGLYSECGVPYAHGWSMQEPMPSTCDMPSEFSAEENAIPHERIRYCGHCTAYVKGFDHHCPAFGNCIGQKNHVFFVVLLVGFVLAEASYVECSSQFTAKVRILDRTGHQTSLSRNLVISTMVFSFLQLLWQVVFLAWHIYCVCFNIRTDEWINWRRYPEFHLIVRPEAGKTNGGEVRFTNPYNNGILSNVKEFLTAVE